MTRTSNSSCSTLVLPILYKMALWGSIRVIVWPQMPDSARECDTLVTMVPTETPMQIAAPELQSFQNGRYKRTSSALSSCDTASS